MKRIRLTPRPNYKQLVEECGFGFHNEYWTEDACYVFTSEEIAVLEKATVACYQMFCDSAQYLLDNRLFPRLQIP